MRDVAVQEVLNYIGGRWGRAQEASTLDVYNPATGQVIGRVPLSGAAEVDRAVRAAAQAFPSWRRTPPGERVQYLFRLKRLLEENLEDLARTITLECGKTLEESRGELRRGIENVEVACGIPTLLQGSTSEDVARGIDEFMFRHPVGVVAAITPFNFPGMIPLWFLPYAIACGNTFILKPSEKVPLTAQKIAGLVEQTGLPAGVVNVVNGARETVDAILDHPLVRAVSFVGSTPVARYVYARAAASGKRAQCQGGAKNPVIVMPDADLEAVSRQVADSAFGCAGQRCLAASLVFPVGSAREPVRAALAQLAASRRVGSGFDPQVEMGPVIRAESKSRIEQLIAQGAAEGARVVVDGRGARVPGYEGGFFLRPTLLDAVPPDGVIARTEIFGPVLGLVPVRDIDEAIALINRHSHGNMACLFTRSGAAARRFRYEAQVGNVGINVGVAAPMAFYPFGGMKESFFGDLHGQGRDAVEFYTDKKVVVERWPEASS
ncbi:MAG: CoA-acylating methylmalonate-semialdehyde dehydrogenase [Armatimonadota bacterium]|nr:CoA-acylating methylmalonate-semialdehyde dehydrogenase [Armatimonadota bacterium]MDR7509495.1 CoA-acylating methylmalonate-semialdehyde dehydrogenase [Armatimonadota bacterium]MDR7516925.1 CoA-acylating methylmalonate-semialdehyde dehydrogenase [Armatimonadota bacterium]MDR7560172.1 CoA-acylating methylmalonate-semialdehyde dehydrogenase [Armatimonadota bacterium]MDR7587888.1 CoA-acylating methylmalonate-semialdehyde dehydrogenase [Armatimonadota bacterium]